MTVSSNELEKVLMHIGVKGMHWGVRNAANKINEVLGRTPGSKDSESVKSLRKKRIKDLSNDDLKKLAQRMQLEQSYKSLVSQAKPEGTKMYAAAYKKYAQEATDAFVKQAMTTGVQALTQYIFNEFKKKA